MTGSSENQPDGRGPRPVLSHAFRAGTTNGHRALVLLHGTYGTEVDLLPLAAEIAPDAPCLSIRGTVAMEFGYAFFRRHPDRRIDEADVAARAPELADFIETFCGEHDLADRPIAVGYSNGAIMAAALLLTRPSLLRGAILLRPLSPFAEDRPSRLEGTRVLIIDGADDDRRARGDGLRLAGRLRDAGATVAHHELPVGHSITAQDERIARAWLRTLE